MINNINEQVMLSTKDNPFNPFTSYDEWLAYDREQGYFTNEYLARVVVTSPNLSDVDQELARLEAIDEIIKTNYLGIYIKVDKDFVPNPIDLNKLLG